MRPFIGIITPFKSGKGLPRGGVNPKGGRRILFWGVGFHSVFSLGKSHGRLSDTIVVGGILCIYYRYGIMI